MRRCPRIVCSSILALAICLLLQANSRADIVVDFGSGGFQGLPYSEDGFTFSNLGGGGFLQGSPNTRLTVNNPGFGVPLVKTRITATSAFDLISFDVVTAPVARNWRLESSSGAIFSLTHGTAAGTKSVAGAGWTNLSFVDIVHDTNEANAVMSLDNFHFVAPSSAPEPHTLLVIPALGLIGYWRCRRVSANRT